MPDILQLKDFMITRLHVDWQAPENPVEYVGKPEEDLFIDYKVLRNAEEQHSLALEFRVKRTPKGKFAAGYSIECEIVGFFDFPETMEEEKIQYLVRFNGGTILYGILRGQIALFTGSFPDGKYTLPAISMQDVVKQVEATHAKVREKAAARNRASVKRKGLEKVKAPAKTTDTKSRKRKADA